MDYISLINLVLVTVIYGTFIAPNLAKLSKLKESILELEFPIKVSAEGSEEKISQNGVTLSKKFAQYSTKYFEIRNFLRYFYVIVVLLIFYQVYRIFFLDKFSAENLAQLVGSVLVILVLGYSLNRYTSHPSVIKSFGWLTRGGIAPVYLKHMYKPKLSINLQSNNDVRDNINEVKVGIQSEVGFSGYNYILTVESLDSRFMYYVSAGYFSKHSGHTALIYNTGQKGSEVQIAKVPLKTGSYKARLLFIGSFFSGSEPIYETILNLAVNEDGITEPKIEKILLGAQTGKTGYSAILTSKRRVRKVVVLPAVNRDDESIERLLTFAPFIRALGKLNRTFDITQLDGQIDKIMLGRVLSRRGILKAYIMRLLKMPKNRKNYLHLT